MKTLAISGIGKRNGLLELIRPVAAQCGLGLLGLDAKEWPPARVAVDHFVTVPLAHEADFSFLYSAALEHYGAIGHMTLVDTEISVLGAAPPAQSRYLNPELETAQLCEDKLNFHCVMERAGIPTIPTSLTPPSDLPFIVKDRQGSAGSGFRVYDQASDAACIVAAAVRQELIYQPFVAGTHLCVDAFFSLEGSHLSDLCVKKVLAKKHGETFLVEAIEPGSVVDLMHAVACSTTLRGIVNFDIYQMAHPDDLAIMEVNCRVGGNYPASHLFGCDMFTPLLEELLSGRPAPRYERPRYIPGQRVGKYFGFTHPF